MTFDFEPVWSELREQCVALPGDAVLVTPSSERPFAVQSVHDDRICVAYRETDEERDLWRDQFEVLHTRLAGGEESLSLAALPPGVEPYVAVLSLSSGFVVAGDEFRAGDGEAGESPFRRATWEVRTTPERVHDDALLLADALERSDAEDVGDGTLSTDELVNLYVLCSDVRSEADRLRRAAGEALLERIGPGGRLHGPFGSVTRTTRERRRLKPTDEVFAALDAEGVPREWVIGVDEDRLDVVLSVTDVEESAVYDVDEQVYAQKTDVEEAEKQSRLQGLKERLADLEGEEAADLHEEIEGLEERIDEVLASS